MNTTIPKIMPAIIPGRKTKPVCVGWKQMELTLNVTASCVGKYIGVMMIQDTFVEIIEKFPIIQE